MAHAEDTPTPPRRRLPRIALALLALVLFCMAVHLLRSDPTWRLGQAVWPSGMSVAGSTLPMGVARGLTWALLAAWLGLGPAALVRMARPWAWLVAFIVSAVVLALAGWWVWLLVITTGFVLAFDPGWLPPKIRANNEEPELVFYDGGCGLCHRGVRLLASADRETALFRFAPLEGRTLKQTLTPAQRDALPDSIVVRTAAGKLLTRSDAVTHVLDRIGGWCRVCSWAMRPVPAPLRDFVYDRVAAVRHTLFKKPDTACPVLSPKMREQMQARFLP